MDHEKEETLDLLALAPSSFAALYGFLVRGGCPPDVRRVWNMLGELETGGKIRFCKLGTDGVFSEIAEAERDAAFRTYEEWLAPMGTDVPIDSVSVDEIGCWLTRTPRATGGSVTSAWQLDEDSAKGEVTIQATDEAEANHVLAEWLTRSGYSLGLLEEPKLESVSGYRLRSGERVEGGVRLTARIVKGSPDAG
jgi:hypothetical protein